MGCGFSQDQSPLSTATFKRTFTGESNGGLKVGTPEKRVMEKAVSPTGVSSDENSLLVMTSSSLVVITTLPGTYAGRRKIRCFRYSNQHQTLDKEATVSVTEKAREKSAPKEPESFRLPEGEFIDGLLGTTEEKELRKIVRSVKSGEYFIDKDFPPDNSSLFFVDEEIDENIEWKRPQELVKKPQLFIGGANRKDVIQGTLGNCWFLSSCAALARKQKLIERVIPSNQSLKGKNYKGLILCRFWRFGDWVTVCIDDFLPTKDGKLIYARSEDENEFWISLLEKAYAKIHGSYQALGGGQSMNALVDLTGGIAERYDTEDTPDKMELFKHIARSSKHGAFITTSRKGDWRQSFKADRYGLVEGHAYTVSGVARVEHKLRGKVCLIRMRNPWGNEAEWKGKWSDGDEMWDHVSVEMRRRLLKDNRGDGEFWMSFDDFYKHFEEISLCSMGPDFDGDGKVDKTGMVLAIKGSWEPGVNAGGSRNNFKKYATNPQYLLTIKEITDEDVDDSLTNIREEKEKSKGKSQVLIGLMQEHRQSVKNEAVKMHQIGFCVYKTDNPNQKIPLAKFYMTYDVGNSGTYINYREVLCRLELSPGYYVIIPATFEPDMSGSFMVRVYSPNKFELNSLD